MGGWLPRLDQPESIADLGVGEGLAPATEVFAGSPALGDRVGDPFPLDLQFHLRQGGHDGKDHRSHRGRGVHVSPTEVEHP